MALQPGQYVMIHSVHRSVFPTDEATGPAHERWAAVIDDAAPTGCASLDRTVAMMAHVIRTRTVDDPYAAVRIVLSFRFGSDATHDAAVEQIAVDLRDEAFA